MNKPLKERVGKEDVRGLSVVIEGSDATLVQAVIKKLLTLLPKDLVVKFDQSFDNRGERILRDTIHLYHTVRAPIDPKTMSLLYVVSYSRRLELINESKKRGELPLMTKSWLEDYRKLLEHNLLEAATYLLDMSLSITPDVWIIIDRKTRNYEKLQTATNAKLISSRKPADEIAFKAYETIIEKARRRQKEVTKNIMSAPAPEPKTVEKTNGPVLPDKVLQAYRTIYAKLVENYDFVVERTKKEKLDATIAEYIRPYEMFTLHLDSKIHTNGDYTPALPTAKLKTYMPRNEFDIAATTQFAQSGSDYDDIQKTIDKQTYEEKVAMVKSSIVERTAGSALTSYDFLLVAPLRDLVAFKAVDTIHNVTPQLPSPLLGYDLPDHLPHDITSTMQQSFDLAVELYSLLQAAGAQDQAYFATLGGHFVRVEVVCSAQDLLKLQQSLSAATLDMIIAAIKEVQPIVGGTLEKLIVLKNRK